MIFAADLGSIWEPKKAPKRLQNEAQNGQKLKPKFNMNNYRFGEPLGPVLGQFGVVIGFILG
jgi:hypothetical protein